MSHWAKSVSYDGSESSHTYSLQDEPYIDTPKALRLLSQIIERAQEEDKLHKAIAIKQGNGANAVGESWMVFHLKALKEILEQ